MRIDREDRICQGEQSRDASDQLREIRSVNTHAGMGRRISATAMMVALLAAGCGGGGGGSVPAGVQVVGGGTTPTPTPSPTASPTPTAAYDRVLATSVNTQFVGIGGAVETVDAGNGSLNVTSSLTSTDDGIVLALMPGVPSAVLGFNGERTGYDPLVAQQGGYTFSQGQTATRPFISFTTGPIGAGFAYVAALVERREASRQEGNALVQRDRLQRALYGAVTRSDDLPGGSRTYTGNVFIDGRVPKSTGYAATDRPASFVDLAANGAAVTTDLAARTVTAMIATEQFTTRPGQTGERARLSLAGTIDARGWISGTITSADSGYTGRFVGRFYGPQGVELGLFVELARADGTRQIGFFAGLR